MIKIYLLFFLLINLFGPTSWARLRGEIVNESSSEISLVDGHELILNGRGTHSILFFPIYEVSLYLEERSNQAEEILNSAKRKAIRMKFLRDIKSGDLQKGFSEGFIENCGNFCEKAQKYLNLLNSKIPDFSEGDSLELQFLPAKLIFRSSRGEYMEISEEDSHLNRILLSLWLGPFPPSKGLLNNLLGK